MIPRHSIHGLVYSTESLKILFKRNCSEDEVELNHFENKFARMCGCKYGVLTGTCRGALYTLLKIKKIKNVYIQPYTCRVATDAVRYAGCKIYFEDIELDTYGLSYESLKNSRSKDDGALVITPLYGCPSRDTDKLLDFAKEKGLFVIEDAAQSFGAWYDGKPVGSFGDCAIFSFDFTKNIPLGAGGIIVTNDEELYVSLKRYQEEAKSFPKGDLVSRTLLMFVTWLATTNGGIYGFLSYLREKTGCIDTHLTMPEYGKDEISDIYTCKFPASLLSLANKVLDRCDKVAEMRMKNAKIYHEYLEDMDGVAMLPWRNTKRFKNVFLRYPIRIANIPKKELFKKFRHRGIDVGDWFSDSILNLAEYKGYKYNSHCPNSDIAYETVINLPVHQNMKASDLEKVCGVVRAVVDEQKGV